MHTHILLSTDGSELSQQAVNYGMALAKAVNPKVTGVTVSTPFQFIALEPHLATDTLESYTARMSTVAAQRLHHVKNAASAAGLECDVVHAQHEHPYRAIIDTAVNRGLDLTVFRLEITAGNALNHLRVPNTHHFAFAVGQRRRALLV